MRGRKTSALLLASAALALTACASTVASSPAPTVATTSSLAAETAESEPQTGVVLDGDCSRTLTPDELREVFGGVAPQVDGLFENVAALGGLSCRWSHGVNTLVVWLFATSVVPVDLLSATPVWCLTDCDEDTGFGRVEGDAVFGDTWVAVSGSGLSLTKVQSALDRAGGRAGAVPTPVAPTLPPYAWSVPECADLEPLVAASLGIELWDYASDSVPSGVAWDVLIRHGAAGWCAWTAEGNTSYADTVELSVWPGAGESAMPSDGEKVSVGGSLAAVHVEAEPPARSSVTARTTEGVIEVSGRFHSRAELVALTEALLAGLSAS